MQSHSFSFLWIVERPDIGWNIFWKTVARVSQVSNLLPPSLLMTPKCSRLVANALLCCILEREPFSKFWSVHRWSSFQRQCFSTKAEHEICYVLDTEYNPCYSSSPQVPRILVKMVRWGIHSKINSVAFLQPSMHWKSSALYGLMLAHLHKGKVLFKLRFI